MALIWFFWVFLYSWTRDPCWGFVLPKLAPTNLQSSVCVPLWQPLCRLRSITSVTWAFSFHVKQIKKKVKRLGGNTLGKWPAFAAGHVSFVAVRDVTEVINLQNIRGVCTHGEFDSSSRTLHLFWPLAPVCISQMLKLINRIITNGHIVELIL